MESQRIERKRLLLYCLFAYGLAVVITAATFIAEHYQIFQFRILVIGIVGEGMY